MKGIGALPAVALVAAMAMLPANAETTIENVRIGQHVSGPQLTKDQLKGKVVLVELWGMR